MHLPLSPALTHGTQHLSHRTHHILCRLGCLTRHNVTQMHHIVWLLHCEVRLDGLRGCAADIGGVARHSLVVEEVRVGDNEQLERRVGEVQRSLRGVRIQDRGRRFVVRQRCLSLGGQVHGSSSHGGDGGQRQQHRSIDVEQSHDVVEGDNGAWQAAAAMASEKDLKARLLERERKALSR